MASWPLYSRIAGKLNVKSPTRNSEVTMRRLKQEAARRNQTVSDLVEAALRALFHEVEPVRDIPPLPEFSSGGARVNAADRDSPEHARCRGLLEGWRSQTTPWYVSWGIVYELLRITTHRNVFRKPFSLTDVWQFLYAVLASASLHVLVETDSHRHVASEVFAEVLLPGLRVVPLPFDSLPFRNMRHVSQSVPGGKCRFLWVFVQDGTLAQVNDDLAYANVKETLEHTVTSVLGPEGIVLVPARQLPVEDSTIVTLGVNFRIVVQIGDQVGGRSFSEFFQCDFNGATRTRLCPGEVRVRRLYKDDKPIYGRLATFPEIALDDHRFCSARIAIGAHLSVSSSFMKLRFRLYSLLSSPMYLSN